MSDEAVAIERSIGQSALSRLTTILTISAGVLVAHPYHAQARLANITPEIEVSPDLVGFIISVTQINDNTGLCLLVPIADPVENRMLTLPSLTILGRPEVANIHQCRCVFSLHPA